MSGKNYHIPPDEFIRVWQSSADLAEVCRRTGMPRPIASARAAGYRSQGIPLKMLKRGRKGMDVGGMLEIATTPGPGLNTDKLRQLRDLVREIGGPQEAKKLIDLLFDQQGG
jgi:hypothetical protein